MLLGALGGVYCADLKIGALARFSKRSQALCALLKRTRAVT
nr:MAG TPA: hypothetical protein [Caudoviricetes sp.]